MEPSKYEIKQTAFIKFNQLYLATSIRNCTKTKNAQTFLDLNAASVIIMFGAEMITCPNLFCMVFFELIIFKPSLA